MNDVILLVLFANIASLIAIVLIGWRLSTMTAVLESRIQHLVDKQLQHCSQLESIATAMIPLRVRRDRDPNRLYPDDPERE